MANVFEAPNRAQGRPRSERARRAILDAAGELLERHGFAAVTVEAIAAQSGVSKATIYRWWPNKAAVVTDSFLELTAPDIHFQDSGSTPEDLRLQMQKLAQVFSSDSGRVVAALVAESVFDAEVATAFRSRWISARREETRTVVQRGVESGEFRPDLDVEVAIDALYGPIYHRLLVGHLPLEPHFIDTLVNYVMAGVCVSDGSPDA
ncbi:MAG: TetR/AcrR family transcriptional regulator [Rubrobacteraceae bacterium]